MYIAAKFSGLCILAQVDTLHMHMVEEHMQSFCQLFYDHVTVCWSFTMMIGMWGG